MAATYVQFDGIQALAIYELLPFGEQRHGSTKDMCRNITDRATSPLL